MMDGGGHEARCPECGSRSGFDVKQGCCYACGPMNVDTRTPEERARDARMQKAESASRLTRFVDGLERGMFDCPQ